MGSSPGILLLLAGGAGLAMLLTGNLDRLLERLAGAPPGESSSGGRSVGGSWEPIPAGDPSSSGAGGSAAARAAYAAGFRGEQLVTAVAIAKGESGWNPRAVGDQQLAGGKWGPSIGLWQIRSLVADAGTGRERDGTRLYDPTFNARAAWTISSGGTNWRPWTVYATGAYRTHLEDARRAIASAGVAGGAGGSARIL